MSAASRTALRLEIEQFLYEEAELADERRFEEWLSLFTDDLQYRMPIVRSLAANDIGKEYLTGPLDISWVDEGKPTLAMRVQQLRTGVHWAEEPLSRVTRLITNVRIIEALPSAEKAQEVEASCKFLIYRNRNADNQDTIIGKRVDRMRRAGDSWLIARRTVFLNQPVLLVNTLSFFV